MKTPEEILKECGFVVTVHEEEIGLVTTAFIEPFMKAMESYASQRIEKYKELIEGQDKINEIIATLLIQSNLEYILFAKEIEIIELRKTVEQLKTELGL